LAVAREKAAEYRRIAREGGNPLELRRKTEAIIPTFADAAKATLEHHKSAWKNAKHADQWINTLTTYVFPVFGETCVDRVETADIMRALTPIWLTKAETARRVRQRISTVMDWAKAAGFRSGDNPTDGVAKGLPRQNGKKAHFDAIPYAKVPGFIQSLQTAATSEIARLAFEFLILTAARTNEVIGARWPEFDLDQAIWTIPAERMKANREHRVPLSPRALAIVKSAQAISTSEVLVFPGRSAHKPMSNMVFLMILRRMKADFTAHGFRSSFRDWASETTNFSREVCEMALAHSIKDKTEAAYRRSELLDKRKKLMNAWADFCETLRLYEQNNGRSEQK
jgi:integrase